MKALRSARFALLLVAALPLAAAQPFQASLWFDEPPALHGEGAAMGLTDGFGLLSLAEAIQAGERVRISWSSADGTEIVRSAAEDGSDVGPFPQHQRHVAPLSPTSSDLRWGAGSLDRLTCGTDCKAFLVSASGGRVGVRGTIRGPLDIQDGPKQFVVEGSNVSTPSRRIVESADEGAFAGPDRLPLASGNVTLYLWDVRGVLHGASGDEALVTGEENDTTHAEIAGVSAGSVKLRTITMNLHGAKLDVPPGSRALLLAGAVDVAMDGSLATGKADGWAENGGARVEVRGQSFEATGTIRMTLAPAPRGNGPAADPVDRLGERQNADLAGDGQLLVEGARIAPKLAAPSVPLEVAGGAAALLALLWALRSGALTAFYTRVTRTRVLDHPIRSALHARVRERPGAHVAELARDLGMGRVALQYHLRMLEIHKLVVPRRRGRLLAYFLPGLVPDEKGISGRVALKDRTRRSVLDAVRLRGSATQAEVATSTGLPVRLVSYHVARLEAAGLLRGDGARPERYEAVTPVPA